MYLEVLGSRKPIIFLEGDTSSIDYELYEQVYATHTIKPLGSCEKVIQTVKAFNEQTSFHHLKSFGIIDRDRRQTSDIVTLNASNIWILDVAEAENLLLLEHVVKAVAAHMDKDRTATFNAVKANIMDFFKSELDNQILLHFRETLRKELIKMNNFLSKDIAGAIVELDSLYSKIDKAKLYNDIKLEFSSFISNQDYQSILRVFNLKNALIPKSKVCEMTGVRNKEDYRKLVVSLLKKNDSISNKMKTEIDIKILKAS